MTGNRKLGFTLVEAMVAAAVASILIVVVVSLFTVFQQIQNTSHEELGLQGAARQMMNSITEAMRTGFVDYDFYTAAPQAEPEYLAVRTTAGVQTVFYFYDPGSGTQIYICTDKTFQETCAKGVNPDAHSDWTKLNSDDVVLTQGNFFIQPDTPQYYDATHSDEPQLVTVRIQLSSTDASPETTPLIQTTFTPRVYAR